MSDTKNNFVFIESQEEDSSIADGIILNINNIFTISCSEEAVDGQVKYIITIVMNIPAASDHRRTDQISVDAIVLKQHVIRYSTKQARDSVFAYLKNFICGVKVPKTRM